MTSNDLLSNLHRCVINTASETLALQDTSVDIAKKNTAVGNSTIKTVGESTLGRLT